MISTPTHDCFVEVKQLHVTFTGVKNPCKPLAAWICVFSAARWWP
jgi:hypothetical protein